MGGRPREAQGGAALGAITGGEGLGPAEIYGKNGGKQRFFLDPQDRIDPLHLQGADGQDSNSTPGSGMLHIHIHTTPTLWLCRYRCRYRYRYKSFLQQQQQQH